MKSKVLPYSQPWHLFGKLPWGTGDILSHSAEQQCLLCSWSLPMGDRTWGSMLKVQTGNALLPKRIKFRVITACPREIWSAEGNDKEESQ